MNTTLFAIVYNGKHIYEQCEIPIDTDNSTAYEVEVREGVRKLRDEKTRQIKEEQSKTSF